MATVIPRKQGEAFDAAIVRRLGMDSSEVVSVDAESVSGDGFATIHVTASLPDAEVRAMFNEAGR